MLDELIGLSDKRERRLDDLDDLGKRISKVESCSRVFCQVFFHVNWCVADVTGW
jgi:hypothetical protein